MSVTFILGRASSGKTTTCYLQIEEELKKEVYTPLILLVPEQFTLQTQDHLCHRFYPGLLRIEVASFNTLAREVFKEVGQMQVPIIEDLERVMILKKIVEEHKKDLLFFRRASQNVGFIEELNHLITVFEQSGISKETLDEFEKETASSHLLQSKLKDIKRIYEAFEAYIQGQYLTVERHMTLLAKNLEKSKKLKEATLWVDSFYGFTGPQLMILQKLIGVCQKVIITLPSDGIYSLEQKIKETHPFYESIRTYQRLVAFCKTENRDYTTQYVEALEEKRKAPEFQYLEKYYFKNYSSPYLAESPHLNLTLYANKNQEIEETAKRILQLVRDEGYRYREIALIIGDLGGYTSHLQNVFKEYEIPYFLDRKRNVHTNSLVAVIEGLLELLTTSYSYKSMMAFLRTGMLGIKREAIDRLENYILAYGIKGKKKWHETWCFAEEGDSSQEAINETRLQILKPIDAFEERLKGEKGKTLTVEVITTALYYFLEDIGAYTQLQMRIEAYKEQGNRLLELENTQIWGQIIEVFERLVELLGEQVTSLTLYKKILSTSFSYMKMGVIPPAKDQVLIGTLDRTRLPSVKAMFIVGTTEGIIPQVDEGLTLFSNMDKLVFGQLCEGKSSEKERLYESLVSSSLYAGQFAVYTVLTRATHKLFVSSPLADDNGKLLRPSSVYYRLKKLFKKEEEVRTSDILQEVTRPLPTFGYVGGKLRDFLEGRNEEEDWKDIVSWYKEQPEWEEKLRGLIQYLFYTNQQHYLEEETTKLLYKDELRTSITRLESFRSCACCYFMRYGIQAEERKIFKWDHAKIGTLFHRALEQYPKELDLLQTTWTKATKEQMDYGIKRATEVALEAVMHSQREEGRFKYTASKVEKMTKRAIYALTQQLLKGEFIPQDYEINFAEGASLPPIEIAIDETRRLLLTGQIDRVDVYYKDEKEAYIKILDYKTGYKSFNLVEVYYGLQLQLLLYLDAYLKLNPDYKPGGIFYFHINNPYVEYKAGMTKEELETTQFKQFKLSGLALEEEEVIEALDRTKSGETIPVSLNKDGSLKKGSSVASLEQFNALEQHIVATIAELGRQILEGKVSAKPYRLGDKQPCDYCKYRTICQFSEGEPDNNYEQLPKLDKEEIWQIVCKLREVSEHGMD
ncbi:PD-(D/E)XK nuclease family protein [Sporanaerobium hydrogeniformans]|uniref:PD-(D/E)XK nuclease family protein n=1 Tax=Sporanaerobium hydrogeniformans TaxID=3072179 RepID=UPI0015D4D992|nr:PD-(D/E)XK nuclease family protein [Sporanaerobium hydrogeniformans]